MLLAALVVFQKQLMITGASISAKSALPSPPSGLSSLWQTCRKIAALLVRPSPRSARTARTCSFLQKPDKTSLSPGEQNQTRGKQPTTVLETERGCGRGPGNVPSQHWRSHQDRELQPPEVLSISSYHPVLVRHPPAAGAAGNFLLHIPTHVMPSASFPEKLQTFYLVIILS